MSAFILKDMDRQQLENELHSQIPLSQFMQVRVVQAEHGLIELEGALGPNHNHLGTAFGGSLTCLMVLAAYCQIFCLINKTGHVLLKSNSTRFLLPVQEDLRAFCRISDEEAVRDFMRTYQKKGKARLTLESQIILRDGRVACQMQAEFVGVR